MFQKILQGGGGKGVETSVIWKNPSITSFSAQTITPATSGWVAGEDIQNYDYIVVIVCNGYSSGIIPFASVMIPTKIETSYNVGLSYPGSNVSGARRVRISGNSLVVSNNYEGSETDNTASVPYVIIGIKGLEEIEDYFKTIS